MKFNKTIIIPFALVGYEMIIVNSALRAISYPTRALGIIVKYYSATTLYENILDN